jgi:general secretion pathway protein G
MNITGFRHDGFTLIEIMVVVVILGILAAVIVPKLTEKPGEASGAFSPLR